MPADLSALVADLAAETVALRALTDPLDEGGWRLDTPAVGWTIADQVGHLAHFDDVAILSAIDPDTFRVEVARVVAAGGVDPDEIAASYRHLEPAEVKAWFDRARPGLLAVFGRLDPTLRVPWFGPDMSVASALTARLMETWAHGQDIADALGVRRRVTDRIVHLVGFAVRTWDFGYQARGLTTPDVQFRFDIVAPSGTVWTFGPADAANRIDGPAEDFCLLVTRRRHPDDLSVRATGPEAVRWLPIAQAYRGPAGQGRRPGQFAYAT
jgi:uncharacterized protein (TIGR03084 family)